jgi:hypothetical protein
VTSPARSYLEALSSCIEHAEEALSHLEPFGDPAYYAWNKDRHPLLYCAFRFQKGQNSEHVELCLSFEPEGLTEAELRVYDEGSLSTYTPWQILDDPEIFALGEIGTDAVLEHVAGRLRAALDGAGIPAQKSRWAP